MINYSIIIPHFNAKELLDRCINSIPKRNDIQIIIVDDYSSEDIYHSILEKYNLLENIEIYQNEKNLGAGFSRNYGINKALGKWLIFSDCDDYFTENAFSFFDSFVNTDNEIIYFDSVINNKVNMKKIQDKCSKNINKYLTGKNKKLIKTNNWEPWGKMFSTVFIKKNKIVFHPVIAMNDAFFTIRASLLAKKIDMSLNQVYVYVIYQNSISRQKSIEKSSARLQEILQINKEILSHKGFVLYTIDIFLPILNFLRDFGMKNITKLYKIFRINGFYIGIPFYSLLQKIERNLLQ